MLPDNLLLIAIDAALKAGQQIIKVYKQNDLEVENKDDLSPITKADKLANKVIIDCLISTNIPVISEEDSIDDMNRYKYPAFWLIDPLDGTKDFIARSGEFGVNIALIVDGDPVIGVIYLPVTSELFFGQKGSGSYLIRAIQTIDQYSEMEKCKIELPTGSNTRPIILQSRIYPNSANEQCAQILSVKLNTDVYLMELGSTAKYTEIAKGRGWFYPRQNCLHKWDLAAGDAIIRFSGGNVFSLLSGEPIKYDLLDHQIPPFLAVSSHALKIISASELILLFHQNIIIEK
jgi:3'(2'), 5'-bisphosphate nucleotidase